MTSRCRLVSRGCRCEGEDKGGVLGAHPYRVLASTPDEANRSTTLLVDLMFRQSEGGESMEDPKWAAKKKKY